MKHFLLLFSCLLLSGCASMLYIGLPADIHSALDQTPVPPFFGGVAIDCVLIVDGRLTELSQPDNGRRFAGALDLPFSLVMDTILAPFIAPFALFWFLNNDTGQVPPHSLGPSGTQPPQATGGQSEEQNGEAH